MLSSLVAASEAVTELRLIRHDANLGIARTMKELYAHARGRWIDFAPADGH